MYASPTRTLLTALSFILLFAGCRKEPGHLELKNAWTRPYTAGNTPTTAIYLTVDNNSNAPAFLTAVTLAHADTVEIHRTTQTDGIMRMRAVDSLGVQPGTQLRFEPGGNHLMVKGLRLNLAEGDSLPFALQFDNGTTLTAAAQVRWE